MAVYRRALAELHDVVRATALEHEMRMARGDIRVARQHALAVLGLLYANSRQPIQALSEGAGESLRHMLRDQDARAVWRQHSQHVFERFGTTCGGTNRNQLLGRDRSVG